jgi:hypothetical protein
MVVGSLKLEISGGGELWSGLCMAVWADLIDFDELFFGWIAIVAVDDPDGRMVKWSFFFGNALVREAMEEEQQGFGVVDWGEV